MKEFQDLFDFYNKNQSACVGFITAFHASYSAEQNIKRNESLGLKLRDMRYDVVAVCSDFVTQYQKEHDIRLTVFPGKGQNNYVKCRFSESELTGYMVVDKSESDLKDRLLRLAVFFEQKYIFLKPQGVLNTLWISSDPHESNFMQVEKEVGKPSFMVTTKGMDIDFNKVCDARLASQGWIGRMSVHVGASKHWSELDLR